MKLTEAQRAKRSWDDGYASGIAYAAAYLVRSYGEKQLAAFLIGDSGLSIVDFRKSKVAGYDLREVGKLFRTEPYLQREGE